MEETLGGGATTRVTWTHNPRWDPGANRLYRWSLLFGLFVVLLCFAHAKVLLHPRFWAEEGREYYPYCAQHDALACLSFAHVGGVQLVENLFVFFATRTPLLLAPAITTYASLAILCVVVAQVIAFAEAFRLGSLASGLLVAAFSLLPANYETWLTATNVQWVFGVSSLLVLVSPAPATVLGRWLQIGWLAACGVSGIPSVVTAPLFGLRILDERSWNAAGLFAAIAGAGVAQLFAVQFLGLHAPRPFQLLPDVFLAADSLQTIVAPVFSVRVADWVATVVTSPQALISLMALVGCVVLALGVSAAIAFAAVTSPSRRAALYLVLGGLFVTNVQVFGALDQKALVSAFGGARYFLFGSACLCLLAELGTTSSYRVLRAASFCALFAIIVAGVVTTKFSGIRLNVSGPNWGRELEKCPVDAPCSVSIWPYGWTVTVERRE